jgi:hypothetical protein
MARLKDVLMETQGLSEAEAEEQMLEAKEAIEEYLEEGDMCAAMDVCAEFWGLEPDYVDDLMFL